MGLGSNINDVSSDSVPLLFIAIIANCICYTRSIVFWVFNSFGFNVVFDYDFDEDHDHDVILVQASDPGLLNAVGLSNGSTTEAASLSSDGLILLNVNHEVYNYNDHHHQEEVEEDDRLQCIVCLCRLRDGDHVRQLGCRHIFHKNCLDGWLIDHFNSTCPLCRSPLVLLGSHQLHLHPHQESMIMAF